MVLAPFPLKLSPPEAEKAIPATPLKTPAPGKAPDTGYRVDIVIQCTHGLRCAAEKPPMAARVTKTLGVVMDAVARIRPNKDTTLGLLDAARRRGWSLVYFEQADLYLRDGAVHGVGRRLCVHLGTDDWAELDEPHEVALADLDIMLMRKDPPLDLEFLYTCTLLEYAARAGVLVVNDPAAIRLSNDKLFSQQFADLAPPTLVSRNRRHLLRFLDEHGDVVIKPLDSMGGASVFRLRKGDQNTDVTIEALTHEGCRSVMVQCLIVGYEKGDKRVLLIDGEPVPFALKRIPPPGQLRANLVAGGRGEVTELDSRDREICARIGPVLRCAGLVFVGIDIIGGLVTEINVSSPTCMREITAETGLDIGAEVMDAIERRRVDAGKP